MRRLTYLLSVASCAALMLLPAPAEAQSYELESLRRRVEEVERQLFQQRLQPAPSTQNPALERLQLRLDLLEHELTSQRVSNAAERTAAARTEETAPTRTLVERIEQLEKARTADAKTIEKLTARILALEKAAARPAVRRKQ